MSQARARLELRKLGLVVPVLHILLINTLRLGSTFFCVLKIPYTGDTESLNRCAPHATNRQTDGHGDSMTEFAQWGLFSENCDPLGPARDNYQ